MKRKVLALTPILALLFSAVAGTLAVKVGSANPFLGYYFDVSPPSDMQPQTITILSPENISVYASNNLTFSFNASLNSTNTWYHIHIDSIYYRASWQEDNVSVYNWSNHDLWNTSDNDPYLTEFSHELNLIEIPEGKQNITITAYATGTYVKSLVYYEFNTNISSSVIFTVDTTPPSFPIALVITASSASVALVSVGLLVYLKRRRAKTGEGPEGMAAIKDAKMEAKDETERAK
jgi:hypothetical protein